MSKRPSLEKFDPNKIAWHRKFIDSFYQDILPRSLEEGTQQILLSGAVGSAKSLIMEHVVSRYMLEYPGVEVCIGRLAMPDLKTTLYKNICEHIPERVMVRPPLKVSPHIQLKNGSTLVGKSWSDYNLAKLGSHEYNAWAIEELTESDRSDAWDTCLMRTREGVDPDDPTSEPRPGFMIGATNPNSPSHWGYTKIIEKAGWIDGEKQLLPNGEEDEDLDYNIWVFYSVTLDNPFLADHYKRNLLKNLSPKMAERMIYGKWVDIVGDGVYHAYDEDIHYIKEDYVVNTNYPIHIGFDYNTASGKPMSAVCAQYIDDKFHFFKEFVLFQSNTKKLMVEIGGSGVLDYDTNYIINGDCNGWNKMSSADYCDYGIIEKFMDLYEKDLDFDIIVPKSNPNLVPRHNATNSYMMNMNDEVRLYVYKDCKMLNKGFKSTILKKGARYVEDDGPAHPYQHGTTAAGYLIMTTTYQEDSDVETMTYRFE